MHAIQQPEKLPKHVEHEAGVTVIHKNYLL